MSIEKEIKKDEQDARENFLKSLGVPALMLLPRPPKSAKVNALLCHSKVIFNEPATILIVGDEKIISKAYSEDFDEEKGLLVCIAKYFGVSYQDIKRLLKNAKNQKTK